MAPTETPPPLPLPFPIFQISGTIERYMLYDINVITWVRKTHNILGVLIGTLPQIPQQNVFLGLPLELQPEEARLLVDQGLAYVVDDLAWHRTDLATKDAAQVDAIRVEMRKQGMKVAKGFLRNKQDRTRKAQKRIREKQSVIIPKSSDINSHPEAEDTMSEETLFNDTPSKGNASTPSPSPSQIDETELQPWSITPTTTYPLFDQPNSSSSPILPVVNPHSYALFSHLHSLGYFMSPGIRFGCQFSVYPGDPLRFHSHFLGMSYEWDEEIELLDLVGGGRLGTGVKKGWLIGGLEDKGGVEEEIPSEGNVRTFCIEWGGM